ncbi:MAG: DUF1566 domain-containing protein [Marinomonas sp.]
MSFYKNMVAMSVGLMTLSLSGCMSTSPTSANTSNASSMMTNKASETDQQLCFDTHDVIECTSSGSFAGQDAQYTGNAQNYTVHGDGTVTDNVTGLMWTQSPDTNGDGKISKVDKLSSGDAVVYCDTLNYAGYSDWQLPNIKQSYSLINFQGIDVDPMVRDTSKLTPFVDTSVFDFAYGNPEERERVIDSQYGTTSAYVNDEGVDMLFGTNLADGRIKGYEEDFFGSDKTYFVQCIRGNVEYGTPEYVDNGDRTITDKQSGLMWAQDDSGAQYSTGINYQTSLDWVRSDANDTTLLKDGSTKNGAMDWIEALAYVKKMNAANYLGHNDWRLPSVKELHTITDYRYSPPKTGTPAIDPIFNMTPIINENGDTDWAFYWSNTTHQAMMNGELYGSYGSYVAFGRSMGYSERYGKWVDVHGAGSQRSDPKAWDGQDYSAGHGPQADAVRVYNYVRLVRDAE